MENVILIISLIIIGITNALTIDAQVNVVRNDCYERLALGQKLKPQDVDRKLEVTNVYECQMACTEEDEKCRTFSFGVGVRGNATCELSRIVLKETPDLKPIGTVNDIDYDLYIKKLGCKLIIPQNYFSNSSSKKTNSQYTQRLPNGADNANIFSSKPYRVQSSYISVAPESNSTDIHYNAGPYKENYRDDFRPHSLPYSDRVFNYKYSSRPSISSYKSSSNDRLNFDFIPRRKDDRYVPDYQQVSQSIKHTIPDKFDRNKLYRLHKRPTSPSYDESYNSELTHHRPMSVSDVGSHYVPVRPDRFSTRPDPLNDNRYESVNDDYFTSDRSNYYDSVKFNPKYPIKIPTSTNEYNSQSYDYSVPNYVYRPGRPIRIPNRPDNYNSDYEQVAMRPVKLPERPDYFGPIRPINDNKFDDYQTTVVPDRPIKIPEGPDNYELNINLPQRPIKLPDVGNVYGSSYGSKHPTKFSSRPGNYQFLLHTEHSERPTNYGSNPNLSDRPIKIPERPYSNYVPERPNEIPQRPTSTGPYHLDWYEPQRPIQIPNILNSDGYDFKHPSDSNYYRDNVQAFNINTPYNRPRDPFNYANRHNSYDSKLSWRRDPPQDLTFYKEVKEENVTSNRGSNVTNLSTNQTSEDSKNEYSKSEITTTTKNTACFRRVLAGKRILRSFVRKAVPCERVEDCQRECSDERRFVCEGFNYRLDPTGRAQGDCELIDLPLSRLDIRRDVIGDSDYDYYERDRNSDAPDCKGIRYYGPYANERDEYYQNNRRGDYYDNFFYDDYYRRKQPGPDTYDDDDYYYNNRRRVYKDYEDYEYHKSEIPHPDDTSYYLSRPDYDYNSYEPYLPPSRWKFRQPLPESDQYWHKYLEERSKDKNYWGFKEEKKDWGSYGGSYGEPHFYYDYDSYPKRNDSYRKYYLIPLESKDWGRYGGTYGYETGRTTNNHENSYDYWGFRKYENNDLLPPYQSKPEYTASYLPPYETGHDYMGIKHGYHDREQHFNYYDDYENYIKDQCSLRMAAGFRLHKGIIKKITSVPDIYECELLCYKENDFPCTSYAFRYTIINNARKENCYLSDRNYKELDYYTDLEPDRDYDIYTINNKATCTKPQKPAQEKSECFWRVRSGQRLDRRIVRNSLSIKSIVDCQLECLRARTFTCRAFSYRYGSSLIGGTIDNCQLTDWPYYDLDPRVHFLAEPGYELYERGSYGHGCEPSPVEIGHKSITPPAEQMDQICYVKYETSSRLLPQATKKSLIVAELIECKAECTREREKGTFQCMSFSFRFDALKGTNNCDLSDILQRDLLSNVDYVTDPDAWLFAWNLHNPNCVSVIVVANAIFRGESILSGHEYSNKEDGSLLLPHIGRPQDTWKVYSVKGLPCKRGTFCQENKVAGFWYCELENQEEFSWDYCCNPDHRCGYSEGFPYQWCYVGLKNTQWRKCNDHYYPYESSVTDRYDYHYSHSYLPSPSSNFVPDYSSASKPSFRPDRPPPDDHFLDPPRPGGFGQSRHWPISYLHKELPQNNSLIDLNSKIDMPKSPKSRHIDNTYDAIGNLIETIKSSELKKLRVSNNDTDRSNSSLHVNLPLPTNNTNSVTTTESFHFETVELTTPQITTQNTSKRSGRNGRFYARSYITKTNRTAIEEDNKRSAIETFRFT